MPRVQPVTGPQRATISLDLLVDTANSPGEDIQLGPPWYEDHLLGLIEAYHTSDQTAPWLGFWYADESKRHLGCELEDGYQAAMNDLAFILNNSPLGHLGDCIQTLETICERSIAKWQQVFSADEVASLMTPEPHPIAERLDAWDRGYRAAVCLFAASVGEACMYTSSSAQKPGL